MPDTATFSLKPFFSWSTGLVWILPVFVAIQFALFVVHDVPLIREETDGIGYMARAVGPLLQTDPFHGPGYSLAIRAIALVGFSLFSSAKIISSLSGILFIVASAAIIRRVSGDRLAWFGTAFVAFNHSTLKYSATAMSDEMGAAAFVAAIALLIVPSKATIRTAVGAGLLFATAYLTRYVYVVGLAIPLWLAICAVAGPQRRGTLKLGLVTVVTFCTAVSPWLLHLYFATGNPFWNLHHLNFAFSLYGKAGNWNTFPLETEYSSLWDVFRRDPRYVAGQLARRLFAFPGELLTFQPTAAVLVGVGALRMLARAGSPTIALIMTSGLYCLAVMMTWYEDRFYLAFLPLIGVAAVLGLRAVPTTFRMSNYRRGNEHGRHLPLRMAVAVLVLAVTCFQARVEVARHLSDQGPELIEAADRLSTMLAGPVTIMASKPHISFFLRERGIDTLYVSYRDPSVQLQDVVLANLPRVVASSGADLFVYDEAYGAIAFPAFRSLLDLDGAGHEGLGREILRISQNGRRVVVFEIHGVSVP